MKFASGSTKPSDWKVYNNGAGMFVEVDTSDAGFTSTPRYFTSLDGRTSHWTLRGMTSIYAADKDSFRIYIRGETPQKAQARGWKINWLAVGD